MTDWLLAGSEGDNIASLALSPSLVDVETDLRGAIIEAGGAPTLSQARASWLVLQYYLSLLLDDPSNYLHHLTELIHLCLDIPEEHAPFSRGEYAFDELGMSHLYGLYYSLDHHAEVPDDLEADRKAKVLQEAKVTLDKYFTTPPENAAI